MGLMAFLYLWLIIFFTKSTITDNYEIIATKEYDVVVVGAGSPGIPAALSLQEEGLKVAVLQKEKTASACGHVGSGIDLEKSSPEDVERLISFVTEQNNHRSKRGLLEVYAQHSGEVVKWFYEYLKKANASVSMMHLPHKEINEKLGTDVHFNTLMIGLKPYNTGEALKDMCAYIEKNIENTHIFYNSPAVKLIKTENKIMGVIAKTPEGYVQFNTKKGVILGTGDYQNDRQMVAQYLPDMLHLETKKTGRTGDGHKMIIEAGGVMENIGHTKMVHDMDSGPMELMSSPLLRVKLNGERFSNEEVGMEYMNCYLLEENGNYCQIFDTEYPQKLAHLGKMPSPETLQNYMPEEPTEKVFWKTASRPIRRICWKNWRINSKSPTKPLSLRP